MKWFICIPCDPWVYIYNTKEEMLAASAKLIQDNYLDGDSGWSEEVAHVFAGFGDIKEKPVRGADWNGYEEYLKTLQTHSIIEEVIDRIENYPQGEEDAEEWPYSSDFDKICNYELVETKPNQLNESD